MKKGQLTLTQKELKRLEVLHAYIDGSISRSHAADLLSLSERQISRLKKGLITHGEASLIHKNTNRKPVHAISDETKEAILSLYSSPEFKDVNFLHFQEILAEKKYDIHLSYSALSSILKSAGLNSPKQKKTSRRPRKRRPRRPCAGELIQIDATPFDWFRSGCRLALHGAIDDATGSIVGLYLCQNECLNGYFETIRQCILRHGVFQSIYSDNHTIFRSPKTGKLTTAELIAGKSVNLTQFGRAVHDLGADIIFAKSSWAKGRIERLWDTLQSRLPVEFARRGISSLEEANRFLQEDFIPSFNLKFSVKAIDPPIWVPLLDSINLDSILCIKVTRKTDAASCFSLKGRCFRIETEGYPLVPARKQISVLVGPRIGILVLYQNHLFATVRYLKPERKDANCSVQPSVKKMVLPHLLHGTDPWKLIWHAEPYELSLKFLYELFFAKANAG